MEDQKRPSSHEEWLQLLDTENWEIPAGTKASSLKGTLRDVATTAHAREQSGQERGVIKHIESAIEVDLIQLQKLWEYLGLPL